MVCYAFFPTEKSCAVERCKPRRKVVWFLVVFSVLRTVFAALFSMFLLFFMLLDVTGVTDSLRIYVKNCGVTRYTLF